MTVEKHKKVAEVNKGKEKAQARTEREEEDEEERRSEVGESATYLMNEGKIKRYEACTWAARKEAKKGEWEKTDPGRKSRKGDEEGGDLREGPESAGENDDGVRDQSRHRKSGRAGERREAQEERG
jgi:hypothetical protein